jgi:hypothetical protein
MIRAQHRPFCPTCSRSTNAIVPMLVRISLKNRSQFFGCVNYRTSDCRRTVSLTAAFDTHAPTSTQILT